MNVQSESLAPSQRAANFTSRDHGLFIEGRFVAGAGGRLEVFDPSTGEAIGTIADATANEVDAAVTSAHAAFRDGRWSGLPPVARERILLRLADLVETHAEELARIETIDQGKSIHVSRLLDIGFSVNVIRYVAGLATKLTGSSLDVSIPLPPGARYTAYTRREPLGVVAAIAPWNFPLMIGLWKAAPALAAGCTVVLKPSEMTSLSALRLAELASEAGIPAGVLNVITGRGPVAGATLAAHPLVAKISFTGSTATGKKLGMAALERLARFTLELGGKNPAIFLEDAPLDKAIPGAIMGGFLNSGQVCAASSRLYVARKIYEPFLEGLRASVDRMNIGPGLDETAQISPLVSAAHRDKVVSHIAKAAEDGARVVTGGRAIDRPGYFVAPAIIADASENLAISRDEVFGPVVTVTPFDDVEEAVNLANDTDFGLTASLWTNDLAKTMEIVPRINAGTVWVNSHNVLDANMPFGGFKQSGIGRDFGPDWLHAYTETKSVCIAY
ncbi:MAG: aldehyde dehydrogenase family protein [Beijerinckiaceae bacterium]|nr:aldehyde dehydrogenase family protein [Beijerinckiaceae bacterium]